MFRGVFVGIDHYQPPFNRLNCAARDAQGLAALFEDSLGGTSTLLVNEDATRTNIIGAIQRQQDAGHDDLVVLTFSGHGTPSHALVPVDASPDDPTSLFDLDELAALLDKVPAKDLFVVLDCCFSGGFGGERSFAPVVKRNAFENRAKLTALGHGRVVLTACGAGEPALETIQLGHGLLTNYLLFALQGPTELSTDPRIPLQGLLQYVTRRVMDDAKAMGAVQTPTVYSSIEGDAHLPILSPGGRWYALFPNSRRAPATDDWASLESYGLPQPTLSRWAGEMQGLNSLQIAAINDHGVLDGKNLLVIAPTSSGKTLIGEIAAVRAASVGGRAVFLLPLKALVNDKYEAFRSTYDGDLKVIRATGDYSDQVDDLLGGHYDLALLTYEKFTSLILVQPHIMRGVTVVVVDEAQMITDKDRGANLEFALTLLRRGYGTTSPAQVIALSAVTVDTGGLERWLNTELLRSEQRPVPLVESVIDRAGNRRQRDPEGRETTVEGFVTPEFGAGSQTSKPYVIGLVRRLVTEGKKVIVFRNWKGKTVGTATYLSRALELPPAGDTIQALPGSDASVSSEALRNALAGGVAFHNADLDTVERMIIETAFRDRLSNLRVVAATTTLAMGINTPAEAVVIEGLDHGRNNPYSVAEYKNMVGRAGRLGQVDAGESYLMATDNLDPSKAWHQYVNGSPEPIQSRLMATGTNPQTILLRTLVALGGSAAEADLVGLVESSFAAWQINAGHPTAHAWPTSLNSHLAALVREGFIDQDPGEKLALTALGRFAGESGIEVTSLLWLAHVIARVAAPLTANDLIALAQVTVELDEVRLRTNSRSVREKRRWRQFLMTHRVQPQIVNSLHTGGGNPTERSKRAAAAIYYTSDTPIADAETELMRYVPDNSAAGPIRSISSRTRDVLDSVAAVSILRAGLDCAEIADDLALRLEFGIPIPLTGLARRLGTRLTRGEYLSLLRAEITDFNTIQTTGFSELARVVGERTAAILKSDDLA